MFYHARPIDMRHQSVFPGMIQFRLSVAVTFVMCLPMTVMACIWDYDTLKQERHRFPSALELITGKFVRHSQEFYEWRIQDRLARLKTDPTNLAWHDDLGVAYEKTGQHDKAIEVMLQKEKLKPGEYETYSNLGTFYILAGEFEKGLPYIDKALAINPDAHFGREKYQKWLVEYEIAKRANQTVFFPPEGEDDNSHSKRWVTDFKDYVALKLGRKLSVGDVQAAVKGVLGMMRFADHENPLLLAALGELLTSTHDTQDAKRLSVRSFLKASYVSNEEEVRAAYFERARWAMVFQTSGPPEKPGVEFEDVIADFAIELHEAKAWYADLKQKELTWIREGDDVDAKFDRLYEEEAEQILRQQQESSETETENRWGRDASIWRFMATGAKWLGAVVACFAIILFIRWHLA